MPKIPVKKQEEETDEKRLEFSLSEIGTTGLKRFGGNVEEEDGRLGVKRGEVIADELGKCDAFDSYGEQFDLRGVRPRCG